MVHAKQAGDQGVRRVAWAVLALLLAFQATLVAVALARGNHARLGGDEHGYVARARHLTEQGRFPRATRDELQAERGLKGVSADTRPPGYSSAVALMSAGELLSPSELRVRVSAVQTVLICLCAALAFQLTLPLIPQRLWIPSAAVLGASPWHFEYATSIYPDSLTAALSFIGISCLWVSICRPRTLLFFAGTILLGSTLLLRPEMIVVATVTIATGIALSCRRTRSFNVVAAVVGLVLPVTAQYAYRVHFTGESRPTFYASWNTPSIGAVRWAGTWSAFEHELYDNVVFRVAGGQVPTYSKRLLGSNLDRPVLSQVAFMLSRNPGNTPEIDGLFSDLAGQRQRTMPLRAWLLPKVSRMVFLWINTNTNGQLLEALSDLPRTFRRPILGALLMVRGSLVFAFLTGVVWLLRRFRSVDSAPRALLVLLLSFVVVRTLLFSVVLNLVEHRYMLPAWLPLLTFVIVAGGSAATLKAREQRAREEGKDGASHTS